MKRVLAPSLLMVAASAVSCFPRVRVMQPIVFKEPAELCENELAFPAEIFAGDPLETAAKNCAQLYNGSVGENLFCSNSSDVMTVVESASILVFGIATGIASTIESDKARKHYTAVGLSAAAVTSALLAYDNFRNCRERAIEEFNIAHARLKHLEAAAYLLGCSKIRSPNADAGGDPPSGDKGGTDGGKRKKAEPKSDDMVELGCSRLSCGELRAKDPSELRDQANAELLRCISIGHPTGFGPVPTVPKS